MPWRHRPEPTLPLGVGHRGIMPWTESAAKIRIGPDRHRSSKSCVGLHVERLNFALTACWRGSGSRPRLPLTQPSFRGQRKPASRRVTSAAICCRIERCARPHPARRICGGTGSVVSTDVSIGGYRMTSATQPQSATPAKRILVVEDELMIRMLLEDMLGELGYTVAAEAARIEEALDAAKNADFDIAILDVNLNGQPISPVADALVARGMPFVFATGYGERGLPEPYRDRPTLKKPFQMDGLKQMLQTALDRGKN